MSDTQETTETSPDSDLETTTGAVQAPQAVEAPAAAEAPVDPAVQEVPPQEVVEVPSAAPEKAQTVGPVTEEASPAPQAAPQAAPQYKLPDQGFYDQDISKFSNEVESGKIKPETYSGLYAKKDTLGKIGTLFGLLLSGAGSGLTHQPNAVLDMMNKEIDRDLDAQQKSSENKRSFLSLAQAHEKQLADIRRMDYENQLTQGQLAMLPAEKKLKLAQANAMDAEHAGLAAKNYAENMAKVAAYGDLADKYKNNPSAQAVLSGTIAPAIAQKISANNAQIGANSQRIMQQAATAQPASHETENPEGVDLPAMQKLIVKGQLGIPGAIPPGEVDKVEKEAKDIESNRAIARAYDDAFKKLNMATAAGKLNPKLRSALLSSLNATIARDTTGRYNTAEARDQISALFPDVTDYGSARAEKYNTFMNKLRTNEREATSLIRLGLKTPFPEYSFSNKSKKQAVIPGGGQASTSGPEVKTMGGVQYEKVAGGWKRLKSSNMAGQ